MINFELRKIYKIMKRALETTKHTIINEDGRTEVFETEKVIKFDTTKDPFYMTFLNFVKWMYGLKGIAPFKVLLHLINIAEFNTGRVHLSTGERRIMLNTLEISEVALYQALKQLLEVGAIKRVYYVDKKTGEQIEMKGEYLINPEMFWKGELTKRKELTVIFKSDIVEDEEKEEN